MRGLGWLGLVPSASILFSLEKLEELLTFIHVPDSPPSTMTMPTSIHTDPKTNDNDYDGASKTSKEVGKC